MATLLIDPIAFAIGPLKVHWYGLILGCAALVGLLLCIREGKRYGIPQDFFMDMLLLGVPSAIIGARIYYVAFKWEDYRDNLVDVLKIWNGGIAIYGALIGAIICGVIYFRYKGYNFWRIADICAPGLLIGQMIGRWGNFMNQEAYGGPVEESFLRSQLHLPDFIVNQMNVNGVFHHPAFLYESIWSLIGVGLLLLLRRRPIRACWGDLCWLFHLVLHWSLFHRASENRQSGFSESRMASFLHKWAVGPNDMVWIRARLSGPSVWKCTYFAAPRYCARAGSRYLHCI